MICNGERPLSSYVSQGGAINRILEVECGEKIYQDPQKTAKTVKRNYGHAGKKFVEIIKEMGEDEIRSIQKEFQKELFNISAFASSATSVVLKSPIYLLSSGFAHTEAATIKDTVFPPSVSPHRSTKNGSPPKT